MNRRSRSTDASRRPSNPLNVSARSVSSSFVSKSDGSRPPSLAPLAGEWESGLTCVEYADEKEGELRLGVYVAYSMDEAEPHIRPLCASSSEDGVSALLCDEDVPSAPISSARRVLDPDLVFVSERQAGGGQGLGNPHGEHGEECFDLREASVGSSVRVVVREGRDTERVL